MVRFFHEFCQISVVSFLEKNLSDFCTPDVFGIHPVLVVPSDALCLTGLIFARLNPRLCTSQAPSFSPLPVTREISGSFSVVTHVSLLSPSYAAVFAASRTYPLIFHSDPSFLPGFFFVSVLELNFLCDLVIRSSFLLYLYSQLPAEHSSVVHICHTACCLHLFRKQIKDVLKGIC